MARASRMPAPGPQHLRTSQWRYPTRGEQDADSADLHGNPSLSTGPETNTKTRHTCYLPAHIVGVAESETRRRSIHLTVQRLMGRHPGPFSTRLPLWGSLLARLTTSLPHYARSHV